MNAQKRMCQSLSLLLLPHPHVLTRYKMKHKPHKHTQNVILWISTVRQSTCTYMQTYRRHRQSMHMKTWTTQTHTPNIAFLAPTRLLSETRALRAISFTCKLTPTSPPHTLSCLACAPVCPCVGVFMHVCERCSCSTGTRWRCYSVLLLFLLTKTRHKEIERQKERNGGSDFIFGIRLSSFSVDKTGMKRGPLKRPHAAVCLSSHVGTG